MTSIAIFNITQLRQDQITILHAQASPERAARADTCKSPEAKGRCLVSEALVRYALGADVILSQDPGGKPWAQNKPGLHFNLSHSGAYVAIAWGTSPVGLDLEQIRTDLPWEKLARRHFTWTEQAYVSETDHIPRFFEIWTAKEGYLKYLSCGLTRPLEELDVFSLEGPQRYQIPLEGYRLTLFAQEPPAPVIYLTPEDIIGKEQPT